MTKLFNDIGGAAAINAAVDLFYSKIMATESLNRFFQDVDVIKQRGKMKKFLTLLTSGKAQNSGDYMRTSHAHLSERGINDGHFDTVGRLLKETLEELSVPRNFIDQILGAVECLRDPVLNRA